MAQSILYYPTIDIQDGAWLRNALLYWDNISSIVPYANYADLSPELLYLEHCGIYKPVFPRDLFASEYVDDFTHAVIARIKCGKRKRTKMFSDEEIHRKKIYAPRLYELVHYKKITFVLYNYLLDNGLLRHSEHEDWIEIDAQAASIYMRTLAEYAIKCCSEDMVMGTDLQKNQYDLYSRTIPSKNSACIAISLNNCLPQPSMNVGYEELLDFKSRHREELLEFRNKLRNYEEALSTCADREEIQFQTEKFKESWQLSLVQSKKMFTREQAAFTFGTLTALLSVPAVAGPWEYVAPVWKGTIASAALLGGTAAIGVGYKFVNYKNKVNEQRSSAGFSYLLKASKAGIIDSI